MDYLDYLPHTNYDALPAEVRATISRSDYGERQKIAQALAGPESPALPPTLASAFQRKTQPLALEKRRSLPWLAAAGWLLFLVTAGLLYFQLPRERTVYQLVSAPVLPAEIIRDTIHNTLTQTVYRTRIKRDTVTIFEAAPLAPPQLVYVTDTVYLSRESSPTIQAVKSSPAAKNLRLLNLLVETE